MTASPPLTEEQVAAPNEMVVGGRPMAPRRSRKASAWMRYYERTASWYADIAIDLAGEYPRASEYAQDEAERFAAGARELRDGKHPYQINGTWK